MIAIIVAYTKNERVIGCNGKIPWNIPDEISHFKELTTGNVVIMGRKTFESIGCPLKNRLNIVVSSKKIFNGENCKTAKTLDEAIKMAKKDKHKKIFICGGEKLYKEALPLCDTLYITEIKNRYIGDTFFPKIDFSKYDKKKMSETKDFACYVLKKL